MFARLLDIAETTRRRSGPHALGKPFKGQFGRKEQKLRWSNFKNLRRRGRCCQVVRDEVFPHFRTLGDSESTFAEYMKDAQLLIQKPSLLVSAVNMIDDLPLTEGDTKGDLYEYLLSKLTTAGINGQFRTPRHIIRLMVDLIEPKPTRSSATQPAARRAFSSALWSILEKYTSPQGGHRPTTTAQKTYYAAICWSHTASISRTAMFHGFDFDVTMLRIAAMNLMLHGVEYAGHPLPGHAQQLVPGRSSPSMPRDGFDLILANPPFKGSLDESDVHPR